MWLGIIIGMAIGAPFGMLIMALCAIARDRRQLDWSDARDPRQGEW